MSSGTYTMFVTSPDIWLQLMTSETWPIREKYMRKLTLKKGDEVLVYLSEKMCIVALMEIEGEIEPMQEVVIRRNVYQYQIPIRIKLLMDEDSVIPFRSIKEKLYLTKGITRWGCKLQRAMVKLTPEDFNLIKKMLEGKV